MSASSDISAFMDGFASAGERAIAAVAEAVQIVGVMIVGDAQQLTPVLTGALQASGTWTDAEVIDSRRIEMIVGFNTSYAAAVHERLDAHHDIGQAKFLETAVRRMSDGGRASQFIANHVREALA